MNENKMSSLMAEMMSLQAECGKDSLHDELYGTKKTEEKKEEISGFQMLPLTDLMPYHSGDLPELIGYDFAKELIDYLQFFCSNQASFECTGTC